MTTKSLEFHCYSSKKLSGHTSFLIFLLLFLLHPFHFDCKYNFILDNLNYINTGRNNFTLYKQNILYYDYLLTHTQPNLTATSAFHFTQIKVAMGYIYAYVFLIFDIQYLYVNSIFSFRLSSLILYVDICNAIINVYFTKP